MRKNFARLIICTAFIASASQAAEMPTKDWAGSQDHPMISRLSGSVITAYQEIEYDQLAIPLGPYKMSKESFDGRYEKGKFAEGKVTRIAYSVPPGKSALEVFRNYQQAMTKAGFEPLYVCNGNECGGFRLPQSLSREIINRKLGNDK